ncbi:hypothetical protein AAHE18_03G312400 [Arachis hypogaea]
MFFFLFSSAIFLLNSIKISLMVRFPSPSLGPVLICCLFILGLWLMKAHVPLFVLSILLMLGPPFSLCFLGILLLSSSFSSALSLSLASFTFLIVADSLAC